jgi:uncharacterized membrane protein
MKTQILYLGDTALKEAACYLSGVMTHFGISFDYVPSDRKVESGWLEKDYHAVIISDYPSTNFTTEQFQRLAKRIEGGMGLLMLGGWESYTGFGGDYNKTILRDVLPVRMQATDDRTNCMQPCLTEKMMDHEILGELPFDACPATIGGFNLFEAKETGKTILSARRFKARHEGGKFYFEPYERATPLLVVENYGQGRVAAFASDVAPHWVGGLVDWGDSRVSAQAAGSVGIEVGNWYATFFANMVRWVGKI